MRTFPGELRDAIRRAIELRAPLHQLEHVPTTVLDQHLNRVLVAETVAGSKRVTDVEIDRVIRPDGCRDAALRVSGVALRRVGLRDDDDVTGTDQIRCRTQPRNPASNHEEVGTNHMRSVHRRSAAPTWPVDELFSARMILLCYIGPCLSPRMHATRIEVTSTLRPYAVLVGDGILRNLDATLQEAGIGSQRVVVSNPVVWRYHGGAVQQALSDVGHTLIPDGERYKNLQTVGKIYDALFRVEADRSAAIVAVGGGVIGDVAGYAAATYLRGIALAHVPTTLLAQIDSAIGGKVGVNHALGKNLIGAFYPPSVVVTDTSVLSTLPRREFRSGLYEAVKYGMIARGGLLDRLATHLSAIFARDQQLLTSLVIDCCRIKAQIVSDDEHEGGPRRALNLGHTVGHALETVTRYRRFAHGEAVAYGLMAASELSAARGTLSPEELARVRDVIRQMGPLPQVADLSIEETLQTIKRDKKVVAGTLHFVLPVTIGEVVTVKDVGEEELTAALRTIGMR